MPEVMVHADDIVIWKPNESTFTTAEASRGQESCKDHNCQAVITTDISDLGEFFSEATGSASKVTSYILDSQGLIPSRDKDISLQCFNMTRMALRASAAQQVIMAIHESACYI
jgi:hypothetical protein